MKEPGNERPGLCFGICPRDMINSTPQAVLRADGETDARPWQSMSAHSPLHFSARPLQTPRPESWAPKCPRESLTHTTAPAPTHMRPDTHVRSDQAGDKHAHPTGREHRVTTLTVTLAERPHARQARSQTHTQRLASRQQAWELCAP